MLHCPHCDHLFETVSLDDEDVRCPQCNRKLWDEESSIIWPPPTGQSAAPDRTVDDAAVRPDRRDSSPHTIPEEGDPDLLSTLDDSSIRPPAALDDLSATAEFPLLGPSASANAPQLPAETFAEPEAVRPAGDRTLVLPDADGDPSLSNDEAPVDPSLRTIAGDGSFAEEDHSPLEQTLQLDDREGEAPIAPDVTAATFISVEEDAGGITAQTFVSEQLPELDPTLGTLVSAIDVSAEELQTIATNFGDQESANPLMTIKSRAESNQSSPSPGEPHDTVPFRALESPGFTPRTPQRAEYELVRMIGEGGMGVVWSARQTSVDRDVAVKMMKGDLAAKPVQRQKFLAEAMVTGDLDHPNIVPIYDVGRDSRGTLFYSMKQVHGTSWNKVLRQKSQPENIDILLRVCDAIAFAHARGIIHRDLKPENIMLGEFGEVLVMDWGLALVYEHAERARRIRQSTSMGGTPAYMAPEMATGPREKITPASDVYLLGAILWEIITGKPPHPGKTVQECLVAAVRNIIIPTEKSGELYDIALRAMATEPAERYPTVRDFQSAIRSYLNHAESIDLARRAGEELGRAEASGDYQLFSKAVFGFDEALRLWDGNTAARTGGETARLSYARTAFQRGDYDLAGSLLTPEIPAQQQLLSEIRLAEQERSTRQQRLKLARRFVQTLVALILIIVSVAFVWIRNERNEALRQKNLADEQRLLAVQSAEEALKQRQVAEEQRHAATRQRDLADMARQEEARQRVLADENAREAERQRQLALQQEQLAKAAAEDALQQQRRAETNAAEARRQQALAEAASAAEKYEAYIARIGLAAAKIQENSFDVALELLQAGEPELRNWEWGRLIHLCSQSLVTAETPAPADGLAIAPDGQHFVVAGWDGTARIFHSVTGQQVRELPHGGQYVHAAAWSPDGRWIVTGGSNSAGRLALWAAESGDLLSTANGHAEAVVSLRFSPDGRWLLSTSYDQTARLWEVTAPDRSSTPTLTERAVLTGHTWWVWSGAFSREFKPLERNSESLLVTAGQDGKAIVWRVTADDSGTLQVLQQATFLAHSGPIHAVDISPSGRVATAGSDGRILLWRIDEVPQFSFDELLSGTPASQDVAELRGHLGAVLTVKFADSSELLVSGGRDNAVMVWNTVTGKALKTFRGHSGVVRSAAFSPDETRVISTSQDHSARIWSIAGYEEFRVLDGRVFAGHSDAVLAATFAPDGERIATAGRDRVAVSWDSRKGTRLQEYAEGHEYLAAQALLTRDRQYLFTSAADQTVRLWNVATGGELLTLSGTGPAAVLALSPDDRWLVTGDAETGLRVYSDLTQQAASIIAPESEPQPQRILSGHHGAVTAAAFLPGSSGLLISADANGRCRLQQVATGEVRWDVRHHTGRITAVAVSPDGERIYTASHDHTVGILVADSGEELGTLPVGQPVSSVTLAPDGQQAVAISTLPGAPSPLAARVTLWNLANRQPIRQFDFPEFAISDVTWMPGSPELLLSCSDNRVRLLPLAATGPDSATTLLDFAQSRLIVWRCSRTADGQWLLTVGGNEARLWDAVTLREHMSFSPHGAIAAIAYSPDGQHLVTGSWDNSAKIWDVDSGQVVRKLVGGHTGFINSVCYAPDGRSILTAGDDGFALLWDATTGENLRRFTGHAGRVFCAAFSSQGDRIVTGSQDRTAILWNTLTGEPLQKFSGHAWGVLSVAFSRDGSRLLTGSEDGTARLWDVATGEQLAVYEGHTAAVTGVAFCRDGARVVTASSDTTAKVWDATPGHEGQEILTLNGHSRELTSIAVSPDGRQILTTGRDGRAILWLAMPWQTTRTAGSQSP
jgi:WD40 repeat protein